MTTLDITPSPRVLRMLGQIDFAPKVVPRNLKSKISDMKKAPYPLERSLNLGCGGRI